MGTLGIPENRKGIRTIFIIASLIVLLAGGVTWFVFVEPQLPPAGRGRRLAEANGCFGCHGSGGRFSRPNPGSSSAAPSSTCLPTAITSIPATSTPFTPMSSGSARKVQLTAEQTVRALNRGRNKE